MLSLEDELSVLDLRYADLLQSVQRLSGCDEEDAEVSFSALPFGQLIDQLLVIVSGHHGLDHIVLSHQ